MIDLRLTITFSVFNDMKTLRQKFCPTELKRVLAHVKIHSQVGARVEGEEVEEDEEGEEEEEEKRRRRRRKRRPLDHEPCNLMKYPRHNE
jgi:hypothetical protein